MPEPSTLHRLAEEIARSPAVVSLLKLALAEDIGPGDVTTRLTVPPEATATAHLVVREDGVLCGLPLLAPIAALNGGAMSFDFRVEEASFVKKGAEVAVVTGRAQDLLSVERLLLNVLQRLSGIATATRRFVEAVRGKDCVILETRKTVPGWRTLDKYAVRAGGGENHRMGLFDQVLAKENHFAAAIRSGRAKDFAGVLDLLMRERPDGMVVEVEVETLDQFRLALERDVPIVMLDDMSFGDIRQAVLEREIRRKATGKPGPLLEVSGGITLATVRDYADCGIERISVGALTHSVKALDIALKIRPT